MTSLTILKENLTWETFLVELSRARKGSTIGNKFGYLCMGAIPFNQNVWFKFSATSITEWSSIFAMYTQIFENYFREVFFPHSTLLPRMSKISGWMVRISEKFQKIPEKSPDFCGKILYQLPLFPELLKF